jgi:ArsR family transcriptional regulator, virulence genes transcriptional regulator
MAGSAFDPTGRSADAAGRAVALLKALSHEGRLLILCQLLDQNMSVGDLAEALGETQPAVSQQLMRLRQEGLVSPIRKGKHVIYRLNSDEVRPVITALRDGFCAIPPV